MANENMKRCSTSLVITAMQIETTMSYHHAPARMANTKKTDYTKGRRGCRATGSLPRVRQNAKW